MGKNNHLVYPRVRQKQEGIRIEVMADSMRVGKTTAVKVIGEGLRKRGNMVIESYEDWQHNPYLKESYADPEKNFLESQKWFVQRKWEQVSKKVDAKVLIQDVSPEMDFCYAETNRRLGRMSEEHFGEYEQFFRQLDWKVAPAPDLLVYLAVGDEELIRRAHESRREFETVDPTYFLMMKQVNREWLAGATVHPDYNVLVVETDKLDFAHEEKARTKLVEMVAKNLKIVN